MTIQLQTPLVFNPGRGQPAEPSAEAKIIGFESVVEPAAHASVTIRVQYGNTVGGAWVPGRMPVEYVLIQNTDAKLGELDAEGNHIETEPAGTAYTDWVLATSASSTETLLYVEVAAALYTYLLTQEGFEGTISA